MITAEEAAGGEPGGGGAWPGTVVTGAVVEVAEAVEVVVVFALVDVVDGVDVEVVGALVDVVVAGFTPSVV